jgi:hypothetical protein
MALFRQQLERAGRPAAAHHALDLVQNVAGMAALRARDARLFNFWFLGLGLARRRTERDADRTARRPPVLRLPAQREAIDPARPRMVRIGLHPDLQLLVFRAVLGRVHVALIEHVAQQQRVAETGHQAVGGAPVALALQGEDPAVERHVLLAEDAGQGGIGLVRVAGPGQRRGLDRGRVGGRDGLLRRGTSRTRQ